MYLCKWKIVSPFAFYRVALFNVALSFCMKGIAMETKDILSILTLGDHFSVTTEKVIELEGNDKPYTRLLKVSTYNIITGEALLRRLFRPPEPSWWVAVDDKVCKHKSTGSLYILAGLDKSAEYHADSTSYYPVDDTTGIIDMEAPFYKADFHWWLPAKGSFTEGYFCLPFSSITEMLHNVSREGVQQAEPVTSINSLLADRVPLPGLPF